MYVFTRQNFDKCNLSHTLLQCNYMSSTAHYKRLCDDNNLSLLLWKIRWNFVIMLLV